MPCLIESSKRVFFDKPVSGRAGSSVVFLDVRERFNDNRIILDSTRWCAALEAWMLKSERPRVH